MFECTFYVYVKANYINDIKIYSYRLVSDYI